MNSTQQLEAGVKEIARQISEGDLSDVYADEGEEPTVYDWLNEQLDVEYVVSSPGEYLGARILACCGGPTIWIDTRAMEVRGYWGSDTFTWGFSDGLDLDEYLEELWEELQ